ncbi:recombinase family protein [Streptomyces anthocyanicus]|uniref:recombinase family protein n=1 Tax=Streptomyces anthocyanicus TaxID=68174 RepID=UPI002F917075|nr:recombinase family protein [Streptomyces anthocyanicus]
MTRQTQESRETEPIPRAVLYVCAERGVVNPTLGAERAEQEGRAFAAARGIAIVETITDPHGQPDPMCRKGWRRVRDLARRGEAEMVIVRWPTALAPDRAQDLRHREIDELLKQGVSVRYSWAPLSQTGTVR